jgi:hypothetical protein
LIGVIAMAISAGALLALVLSRADSSSPSSRADSSFTYFGRKFASAKAALEDRRSYLEAQAALVAVSPSPLPGKLLIVIPENALVEKQYRDLRLSGEELDFQIARDRMDHFAYAQAIAKSHPVETADIIEGSTTERPRFDGYDYIAWYQVKWLSAAPMILEGWQMGKRGSTEDLSADIGRNNPDPTMAELVAGIDRTLVRLATQPLTAAAPATSRPSPPLPAANAVAGSFTINFPPDWRTERDAAGRAARGISPSGDVCQVAMRAGTEPDAPQEKIDQEYAAMSDDALLVLMQLLAPNKRSVIDRAGKKLLHGRPVLWLEGRRTDAASLSIDQIGAPTPWTMYFLTCTLSNEGRDAENRKALFQSIAETFYWGDQALSPRPANGR